MYIVMRNGSIKHRNYARHSQEHGTPMIPKQATSSFHLGRFFFPYKTTVQTDFHSARNFSDLPVFIHIWQCPALLMPDLVM